MFLNRTNWSENHQADGYLILYCLLYLKLFIFTGNSFFEINLDRLYAHENEWNAVRQKNSSQHVVFTAVDFAVCFVTVKMIVGVLKLFYYRQKTTKKYKRKSTLLCPSFCTARIFKISALCREHFNKPLHHPFPWTVGVNISRDLTFFYLYQLCLKSSTLCNFLLEMTRPRDLFSDILFKK